MRNAPDSVKQYISYDPETGEFTRLEKAGLTEAGERADRAYPLGYRRIRFHGGEYQAHRVAWFFVFGVWPTQMIDHINMDRQDNRIANLRLASLSMNGANARKRRGGLKGATFHKATGKFQAAIKVKGRSIYLGLFETEQAAHGAYAIAAAKHFGEFARAA